MARARSRDGAKPRSTTRMSNRVFDDIGSAIGRVSVAAGHNPIGNRLQPSSAEARLIEHVESTCRALVRERPRSFQTKERRITGLRARGILAGALPQGCGIALDVEHIVDDLKRETDEAGVLAHRAD